MCNIGLTTTNVIMGISKSTWAFLYALHGMQTHMREGADAAPRPRMSLSLGARSCRALTWNASGAKRSTGISTWCSMARLQYIAQSSGGSLFII